MQAFKNISPPSHPNKFGEWNCQKGRGGGGGGSSFEMDQHFFLPNFLSRPQTKRPQQNNYHRNRYTHKNAYVTNKDVFLFWPEKNLNPIILTKNITKETVPTFMDRHLFRHINQKLDC
jgi:hypothetical protein